MRKTALLAASSLISAAALAQDPAPVPQRPTGTVLLDALPPQADVVVCAPDFPALLDAYAGAGLGDAAAWRDAFEAQLRAWGEPSGAADRLVRGGRALLAAADGEVLIASVELKLPDVANSRATLFAMRSTKDQNALREAFGDLLEGGLKLRWPGEKRVEQVAGRQTVVLYGDRGNLFVHIANGFIAASDHPLALGLLFRGLGKDASQPPANRPTGGSLKMVVRRGRGDAQWDGWIWGDAETVEWRDTKIHEASELPNTSGNRVCFVAWPRIEDVPLLPIPVGEADRKSLEAPLRAFGQGTHLQIAFDDGKFSLGMRQPDAGPMPESASVRPGGAYRLGWLRALADGKLPSPFPDIAQPAFRGPADTAAKAAVGVAGESVPWKSTQPGRLSGPIGHGPTTFLALRCLHDIGHAVGPGAEPPPPPPQWPVAPLPPPTEPTDK